MPAAAEGPDTEDLKISPFARGEWSQEERILLDVSFTSLAEVLGDEDDEVALSASPPASHSTPLLQHICVHQPPLAIMISNIDYS